MIGLVIREPWIDYILAGTKTWELRSTRTSYPKKIALIRKGSGRVVGTANLVGCEAPIANESEFARTRKYHQVPSFSMAAKGNWLTPWVLASVKALDQPIAYEHPAGAVIWVKLPARTIKKIEEQ
jgi:hypothetical protein